LARDGEAIAGPADGRVRRQSVHATILQNSLAVTRSEEVCVLLWHEVQAYVRAEAEDFRDVNARTDEAISHRLSMLDQLTVFPKVLCPLSGHRDESSASWFMVMLDEASFIGVFPYRKARARRPPGLDYLGVRPRVVVYLYPADKSPT
jgi:hypothetical protein